jgi:CRISPR/Cas system-associated exonuclease Cas4 (RecB family)
MMAYNLCYVDLPGVAGWQQGYFMDLRLLVRDKMRGSRSNSDAQMELFDYGKNAVGSTRLDVDPARMEWSYSRRSLFYQCNFAYYNNYYGANLQVALDEPRKTQLHFLKSLANRHLRTGKLLHLVIGTYLKRAKQGDVWSLDRLHRWARDLYQTDLAFSRAFRRNTYDLPTGLYSPVLLAEFYYQRDDAEALWKESLERLLTALSTFSSKPDLERFRRGATHSTSIIEKSIHMKDQQLSLVAQPDLAHPDERNRYTVVDWKIGEAGGGEDSLQLFSYALVTMKEFDCSPEDMDLYKVYLSDGAVAEFKMDERKVFRTKALIIKDVEKMKSLDSYGRDGISDAFTPCNNPRICAGCPFQEICFKR